MKSEQNKKKRQSSIRKLSFLFGACDAGMLRKQSSGLFLMQDYKMRQHFGNQQKHSLVFTMSPVTKNIPKVFVLGVDWSL